MKSATFFCLMALGAVTIDGAFGDVPLDMLARNQVSCDSAQVHVCAAPVQEFLVEFDVSMLERLMETSNLDRLCNQLNDTKLCVSNIQPGCNIPDSIRWAFQLYQDVVDYICSAEGRDVLLAGKNCFENLKKANTLERCFGNFEQFVNDQDPCGLFDRISSCVKDNVGNVCSNKERDFAGTVMSRYLAPVKSTAGCEVGSKAIRASDLRMLFNL